VPLAVEGPARFARFSGPTADAVVHPNGSDLVLQSCAVGVSPQRTRSPRDPRFRYWCPLPARRKVTDMPTQTVDGASLYYADQGTGPAAPLVLAHAFPVDHRMWAAQLADLSADRRVIAPDARGFGRSAPAPTPAPGSPTAGTPAADPLSVDGMADDLRALLSAAGALPCVLGGLSMGGYVALAFARKFPADLRGLILMDTRADADGPEAREGRQKAIDLVRQKGPGGIADQMVPKLLAPGAAAARADVAGTLRAMIEAQSAATIERALVALRDRPDSTALLPTIAVPTLVVVGDGDQVTPPALAEAMGQAVPGATLTVVRGAGHMSAMEQPAQVNQAVRAFLQLVG
jgi:3-oxoadipate enol-lactonase